METEKKLNLKCKVHFLFIAVLMVGLSSCQSKEDKAVALINQYMKTVLYDYDSYEVNQIVLDSAFTTPYMMEDAQEFAETIIKARENIASEKMKLSRNESSMAIWKPSGYYTDEYSRHKYEEARSYVEQNKNYLQKYQETLEEATQSIEEYLAMFESEYVGWFCQLNYRCKTRGGMQSIENGVFFIDPQFNEITLAIPDVNDEKLVQIVEVIEEFISEMEN